MTISVSALSQHVLGDLLENHTSQEIEMMTTGEAFDAWLKFQGIIGYGDEIRKVLFDIASSSGKALCATDKAQEDFVRENYFDLEASEVLK